MSDIAQPQTRILQHPADRVLGKLHRVFAPRAKPFLRHRADELSIDNKAGRSIGVKGIEPENGGHDAVLSFCEEGNAVAAWPGGTVAGGAPGAKNRANSSGVKPTALAAACQRGSPGR
jgi:hypothetical protein